MRSGGWDFGCGFAMVTFLATMLVFAATSSGQAQGIAPQGAAPAPAASAVPAGALLDGSAVRTTLAGNSTGTILKVGDRPTEFTIYYDPSGALAIVGSDGFRDDGEWRVLADGRYCSRWKKLRRGAESCAAVYRAGTALRFVDGQGELLATLMPGNQLQKLR